MYLSKRASAMYHDSREIQDVEEGRRLFCFLSLLRILIKREEEDKFMKEAEAVERRVNKFAQISNLKKL